MSGPDVWQAFTIWNRTVCAFVAGQRWAGYYDFNWWWFAAPLLFDFVLWYFATDGGKK